MDRDEPKPPSAKGLSAHRKMLEEEGVESGREVHEQYRSEVIQMKRAMAELRSAEPKDDALSADATWLERIGEWFGDFLAEPSAGADNHRHPGPARRPRAGPGLRARIASTATNSTHGSFIVSPAALLIRARRGPSRIVPEISRTAPSANAAWKAPLPAQVS